MKLLQEGNTPNVPIETWLCDTIEEISNIPSSTPVGSIAIVPTDGGLVAKMKNSAGQWKSL